MTLQTVGTQIYSNQFFFKTVERKENWWTRKESRVGNADDGLAGL